jgi:hypothetical protein
VVQGPEDRSPRIVEKSANFDISDLDIEFDISTLKHNVLVPMLTKLFKIQIKQQIEYQVEKNIVGFMKKLGELMSSSISETNRPFVSGFEAARKAVKSSPLAEIFQKRKEKLE